MNRHRVRYYKPTVGSDHIPDPWAWLDTAIPVALCLVALGIIGATAWFQ